MTQPSELTAAALLDGAACRPADLATAYDLLARLGPDHLLYLPMSADGELWADFSQLPLMLSGLTRETDTSALPIDISPLAQLCRKHRRGIEEGELWVYRFFYLELLSHEGTLRPLFWAAPAVAAALKTYQALAIHSGQEPALLELHAKECQQVWEEQGDRWIEAGLIECDTGRPWLSYLRYQVSEPPDWQTADQRPFARCLVFEKLPFFDLDDAYNAVVRAMKLELWRTSIFCPAPMPNREDKRLQEACHRLALPHQRRTQQQARRVALDRFVREQYKKGMAKRAIAREAVARGLWPFGTRKKTSKDTIDDVEKCRRTVIRMLK